MTFSNWREVLLEEVADEITVGFVGSMTSEYVESGIPFLRSKNVEPYGIKWDDMRFIGREFHNKLKKSALSPGDVVIVRTGKPGSAALIPNSLQEANCSDVVIVRPGNDLDARFLVYYLNSVAIHHVNAHLVGAVQQHFNVGSARQLRMRLPEIDEQKKIAYILGTLDDKIELNQQMNRTLEDIARALFKSWFIDFDPVRAKLDGRQPAGMDAETAALFPDSFEDSPLGKIPKGWRVGVVDDLIEILSGGTPKTSISEYWGGDIPWFSVKDAPTESDLYVLETEKYVTDEGVNNSSTQVLPVGTTIVSARGTVGRLALVGAPMAMNQSCYGIRGKENYSDLFIYYFIRSAISSLLQQTHGTVFETITRQTFTTVKSINPPVEIAQSFDKSVQPFLQQIRNNLLENRSIISTRDALLPKLLSGEILVKVAEQALEAVV